MAIDIPESLLDLLRQRAEQSGMSIRSVILHAIEQTYGEPRRRKRLKGPFLRASGKLGPAFPTHENPHDLVLS